MADMPQRDDASSLTQSSQFRFTTAELKDSLKPSVSQPTPSPVRGNAARRRLRSSGTSSLSQSRSYSAGSQGSRQASQKNVWIAPQEESTPIPKMKNKSAGENPYRPQHQQQSAPQWLTELSSSNADDDDDVEVEVDGKRVRRSNSGGSKDDTGSERSDSDRATDRDPIFSDRLNAYIASYEEDDYHAEPVGYFVQRQERPSIQRSTTQSTSLSQIQPGQRLPSHSPSLEVEQGSIVDWTDDLFEEQGRSMDADEELGDALESVLPLIQDTKPSEGSDLLSSRGPEREPSKIWKISSSCSSSKVELQQDQERIQLQDSRIVTSTRIATNVSKDKLEFKVQRREDKTQSGTPPRTGPDAYSRQTNPWRTQFLSFTHNSSPREGARAKGQQSKALPHQAVIQSSQGSSPGMKDFLQDKRRSSLEAVMIPPVAKEPEPVKLKPNTKATGVTKPRALIEVLQYVEIPRFTRRRKLVKSKVMTEAHQESQEEKMRPSGAKRPRITKASDEGWKPEMNLDTPQETKIYREDVQEARVDNDEWREDAAAEMDASDHEQGQDQEQDQDVIDSDASDDEQMSFSNRRRKSALSIALESPDSRTASHDDGLPDISDAAPIVARPIPSISSRPIFVVQGKGRNRVVSREPRDYSSGRQLGSIAEDKAISTEDDGASNDDPWDVKRIRSIWKAHGFRWPFWTGDEGSFEPEPYSSKFLFGTALPLPKQRQN
ncbi:hypothetical protein BGZ54_004653 [Gamsiella multidivaricata]|nr:hypothetical protein BGZ54_004653 [Gamsiella multidivaricata]